MNKTVNKTEFAKTKILRYTKKCLRVFGCRHPKDGLNSLMPTNKNRNCTMSIEKADVNLVELSECRGEIKRFTKPRRA